MEEEEEEDDEDIDDDDDEIEDSSIDNGDLSGSSSHLEGSCESMSS